jgi:hypothetical protein
MKAPGGMTSSPSGTRWGGDGRGHVRGRADHRELGPGLRAVAPPGLGAAYVTGCGAATALDTTAQETGGDPAPRTRQGSDPRGPGQERAVTGYGWQRSGRLTARTPLPLAATMGPLPAPDTRSRRARLTPARTPLAGDPQLPKVVCAQGIGVCQR